MRRHGGATGNPGGEGERVRTGHRARNARGRAAIVGVLGALFALALTPAAQADLYFPTGSLTQNVGRSALDGTGATTLITGAGSSRPVTGIAHYGNHLCFVESGSTATSIGRVTLNPDGSVVAGSENFNFVEGMAGSITGLGISSDGHYLFWANYGLFGSGTLVGRATLDENGDL